MHDRGQRMSGVDVGQQGRHLVPIRHVAGGDGHVRAVRGQLPLQLGCPGRFQATAAGQQQVPYAPLGHQMPGQTAPQTTGATSDQNCPVRIPRPFRLLGRCHPGQTRHPYRAFTHRRLRLTGGQHRGQRRGGQLRVDIDQHEPAWILPLRRTHQAPHRRSRQIGDRFTLTRGHRAPRHEHQPRSPEPLVGQPPLEQVEDVGDQLVRRLRHVLGVGRLDGDHDHVGC
ncbi:hypothetical protein Aple_058480 [Acrocarpospora pleiomorpha]|uniref:Uncharacterized protein n=1 Tax=Acrocarpospora pleiomorpha TaxID=90975 RepID=A0A5M3XSK6_9ACTN|nr:hypothetical protein Aple_058480 [Acrocarpospora pleiomorpha]